MIQKVFLTEKELASRWSILTKTLRQWRWEEKGPSYFKICGRISYRFKDVEQYEEENEGKKLRMAKKGGKLGL